MPNQQINNNYNIIIIYNSKQYRSESAVMSVYEHFAVIKRAKSTDNLYFIIR